MTAKRGLTAREVLCVITDIAENVSEYENKGFSLDANHDQIPVTDESNSSSEDVY